MSSVHFQQGLQSRLAEAENFALAEVARLGEALTELRAENARLRSLLGMEPVVDSVAVSVDNTAMDNRLVDSQTTVVTGGNMGVTPRMSKRDSSATLSADSLRRRLGKTRTEPRDPYHVSGRAQQIARSPWFEYTILIVVLLNALWISVDLDLNGKPLLESPAIFQIVEHTFLVIFVGEVVVRFMAFKDKRSIWLDRWFIFDASLVLFMVLESWVFTLVIWFSSGTGSTNLAIGSALRILRLLRLTRVARLCRIVPELKTMVSGMIAGIRSVLVTAVILFSMTYIFAIMLRQQGSSSAYGRELFPSVPATIYRLLIDSMLPDNSEKLGKLGSDVGLAAIYFTFLLLSAITVMNMLIGILCDVVGRVSNEEKEMRSLDIFSEKLQGVLRSIDDNYDGQVSKAEFQGIVANDDVLKIMLDIGVDVQSLVEDADYIFPDSSRSLPFEEFKEIVLQFRATTTATMRAVAILRKFVRSNMWAIRMRLANIEGLLSSEASFPNVRV